MTAPPPSASLPPRTNNQETMKTLIAYHGKPSEKKALLKQLHAHAVADEIVKGKYWENGKGCAIGCILHSGDHAELEPRFGVPVHIGYLVDVIFENLPNALSKAWPERFAKAIKPGSDLSKVYPLFTVWMLTDPKDGVIRFADKDGEKAIRAVSDLFLSRANGKEPSPAPRAAARAAAGGAAGNAAGAAAGAAARAAAGAAASDAARDAARAAAWAA